METSRLTDILKLAEAGTPVAQLCCEHGMRSASFYQWRSRFGRMDTIHDGPSERFRRRWQNITSVKNGGLPGLI